MKALARLLSGNLSLQSANIPEKAETLSRTGSGSEAEDNVLRDKFDKDKSSSPEDHKHAKHVSGGKVS